MDIRTYPSICLHDSRHSVRRSEDRWLEQSAREDGSGSILKASCIEQHMCGLAGPRRKKGWLKVKTLFRYRFSSNRGLQAEVEVVRGHESRIKEWPGSAGVLVLVLFYRKMW